MKKFIVAIVIIGLFITYSFIYHSSAVAVLPNNTTNSGSSASSTSVVQPTPTPTFDPSTGGSVPATPTPTTAASTSSSSYKDGSYTGSVADAHWGNIQVKAIIKGGKIADVQFLQYPNDRNRSISINEYADPQLTSEAVQVQSANVDIITGATDSSEAFMQSLSDALTQAKA